LSRNRVGGFALLNTTRVPCPPEYIAGRLTLSVIRITVRVMTAMLASAERDTPRACCAFA